MASQAYSARVFKYTRAGNPVIDPVQFLSLSAAALTTVPDGATFITRRSDAGLEHLLVTDNSPAQEGVAFQIAQAMHARVEEDDDLPDLTAASEMAKLKWTRKSMFGVSNMAGADVSTIAQMVGGFLMQDEWVAMSVRHPSKSEAKWNAAWARALSGGLSHQSMQSHSTVVSIWSGTRPGRSEASVQSLAGALPGFSIRADAERVSGVRSSRRMFGAGAVIAVLAVTANVFFGGLFGAVSTWWPALLAFGVAVFGYGVGAAGIIPGVILPGRWKNVRQTLAWGRVPMPARRLLKPRQPVQQRPGPDGTILPARDGEYPLWPDAFLVSGHYPCLIINPHAGAFSASSGQTTERPTPAPLRDPNIGVEIGSNAGEYAFLSWADMWSGTFLAGVAGSGKTALLEWIWGETCRAITSGARVTPIAIDTKGDGEATRQMVAWATEHHQQVGQFHVADTSAGFAIEMFPRVGSVERQSRRIVDAFIYLYGEQSVGARSMDTLARVFHAALTLTPELVTQSGASQFGINPHGSPFHFANAFLGGLGDAAGKTLAEHLFVSAADTQDDALLQARAALMPLYGSEVTPSKRRDTVEAPRNKVAALLGMEHWWSAPRKVTWKTILESQQPAIINTGVAPSGEQPSDQRITEEMGALVLFSLRTAIQETCAGWQAQNRAVRIFADEVKAVAAASPDVVTWLRSDGRAYGVEAVFATQQPSQLPPEVRTAVMSFGTMIAYRQDEEGTAKEIAASLSLDGSTWEVQDVAMLPQYTAIVRSVFQQARLAAFTMAVPDFRARRRTELVGQAHAAAPRAEEVAAADNWYLAGAHAATEPPAAPQRIIAGQMPQQATETPTVAPGPVDIDDAAQPGISGW